MKDKILITGATGYIGSNLAKNLLDNGYNVHIIVRSTSDIQNNPVFAHTGVTLHAYAGETTDLISCMENIKPDIIFHLASLFISEHKPENIEPLIQSNILFGSQLLEAAAKSGVRYFINTGTHWQNYNGAAYNPKNLYAATKQAFECMARFYLETSDMRMLTVKLIDTYGPFDIRPKAMSLFKRIAKSGEVLDMSPGDQELGLLYIDDVIKGFMLAFNYVYKMEPHEQRSFMLAPHEFSTLRQVAQIFEKASGQLLNINWGGRTYREREVMKVVLNEANILQGQKVMSLHDGIKLMLDKEGYFNDYL